MPAVRAASRVRAPAGHPGAGGMLAQWSLPPQSPVHISARSLSPVCLEKNFEIKKTYFCNKNGLISYLQKCFYLNH